jgi:hypothetical protein
MEFKKECITDVLTEEGRLINYKDEINTIYVEYYTSKNECELEVGVKNVLTTLSNNKGKGWVYIYGVGANLKTGFVEYSEDDDIFDVFELLCPYEDVKEFVIELKEYIK